MWCCGYNPRCLRVRERSIALLTLVCVAGTIVAPGCAHNSVMTDIKSVDLIVSAVVNWDADPEPDGIQFIMRPQDDTGLVVRAEGILNAKLWSQPYTSRDKKSKLIEEWSNIQVTKKDYTEELGVRVHLEYSDYVPHPCENGILEVTLVTLDGKSFWFEEANIMLGYSNKKSGGTPPSACCP